MISHRSTKRPVIGARVAVPISDTCYVPATIQAISNDAKGNEYVTVKFDDNNKAACLLSGVVGTGFKSIHDIRLHKHQKVFIEHNGREVVGCVEQHSDGIVIVTIQESEKETVTRREDEVRLTESRYSPRLQEHNQELDYRKIASANASPNHGKKRPVSASIEVPKASRARKSSAEPTMDELMAAMVLSSLSSSPVFHNPKSPPAKKAGSSPHSYGSSGVGSWSQDHQMSPVRGELPPQGASHPAIRHLHGTPERNKSVIQLNPSIEHSPASTGDPIDVDPAAISDASIPMDEDVNEHGHSSGVVPPGHSTPAPFQTGSPRLQFQMNSSSSPSHHPTLLNKSGSKLEAVKEEPSDRESENPRQEVPYQGPSLFYLPPVLPTALGRPEYIVHMQPVSTPPPPLAPAEDRPFRDLSPYPAQHQIQSEVLIPSPDDNRVYIGSAPSFYTIPIMGSSPLSSSPLAFTPASHMRHTPSPLASGKVITSSAGTTPLQNMKLAAAPRPIPMSAYAVLKDHAYPSQSAQPINIPAAKSFSWHSTGVPQNFSTKPSIIQQRQQMHQAASPKMAMSPKTLPPGRKVRGDGKKCRKVYGMENREMWCTACRWKKACQRFPD